MSEDPTVRLSSDGKPIGFIDHPEEYRTISYEVIEDAERIRRAHDPRNTFRNLESKLR